MLATPTTKDFTNIMTFLLRQIDPHLLKGLGKLEEEVPALYKRLRYPFQARACLRVRACVWCARLPPTLSPTPSPTHPLTHLLQISKSNLTAVGSPHTWPSMLAALTWLVELLCYQQRAEAARADVGGERARAEADFFQYVATSYRHFMAGALGGGGCRAGGRRAGGGGGHQYLSVLCRSALELHMGARPIHPSIHDGSSFTPPPPCCVCRRGRAVRPGGRSKGRRIRGAGGGSQGAHRAAGGGACVWVCARVHAGVRVAMGAQGAAQGGGVPATTSPCGRTAALAFGRHTRWGPTPTFSPAPLTPPLPLPVQ